MLPVTDNSFNQALSDAKTPVVILDFWATWCGPCNALKPVLAGIAKSNPDKVTILTANVDECPELAGRFHVKSLPTMLRIENGEVTAQSTGRIGSLEILDLCGIK